MDTDLFPPSYDNFKIFLFRKVERISLALYLSTNHLPHDFYLKTDIRRMADMLIKDILHFNNGQDVLHSTIRIKEHFLELKTLINFASASDVINQKNANLLIEEIIRISREVDNQKDNVAGHSEFKKSFFVVESRTKLHENTQDKEYLDKGHKGQAIISQVTHKNQEKENLNKGQLEAENQNGRTKEILDIIKDTGKVTIKDISSRIRNCSEKTIQRELLRLVSLNVVKKEGERRWSTYSIDF